MSHGGNGESPLLVGAQEVVEAIGQPGGFLILGLALGEVGEFFLSCGDESITCGRTWTRAKW